LRKRVVLENDDKPSGWSVFHLHEYIYKRSGIPITFDFHHYLFCNGDFMDLSMRQEFELAYSTWKGRSMQVHYSQSPTPEKLIPAHGMFYRDPLPSWIREYSNIHIHLECKSKEAGLIKYRNDFEKDNI
jgi:UV DNA damage endonuclease